MLKQLGARLPARNDGRRIVPPVTGEGSDGDAMLERLKAASDGSQSDRNKIAVASSKSSSPPDTLRADDYRQLRRGFEHLRELGVANGAGDLVGYAIIAR